MLHYEIMHYVIILQYVITAKCYRLHNFIQQHYPIIIIVIMMIQISYILLRLYYIMHCYISY